MVRTTIDKTLSICLTLAIPVAVFAVTAAAVLQEKSPLAGTWNANVAKSKQHPNHLFKSATLTFVIADGVVTLNYAGVNMSGVEETGKTRFHPDGKEHPLEGLSGAVEVSRWVGPRTLETIASQNGKVIGQSTFEVSSDGKSLTAKIKGTDASGSLFEQAIVCDRK